MSSSGLSAPVHPAPSFLLCTSAYSAPPPPPSTRPALPALPAAPRLTHGSSRDRKPNSPLRLVLFSSFHGEYSGVCFFILLLNNFHGRDSELPRVRFDVCVVFKVDVVVGLKPREVKAPCGRQGGGGGGGLRSAVRSNETRPPRIRTRLFFKTTKLLHLLWGTHCEPRVGAGVRRQESVLREEQPQVSRTLAPCVFPG